MSGKRVAVKSMQMTAWCVCGNEEIIVEKNIPRSYATEYFEYRDDGEKEIDTGRSIGFGRPILKKAIKDILRKHLEAAKAEIVKASRATGTKCHND